MPTRRAARCRSSARLRSSPRPRWPRIATWWWSACRPRCSARSYHLEDSAWSPRRVLRENTSHCYEGALFAAAALRVIGYPPLLLDLEAEHDTDHVLAIYKVDGHWGAVAK